MEQTIEKANERFVCNNCNTTISKEDRYCTECGKLTKEEYTLNYKYRHFLSFSTFAIILYLVKLFNINSYSYLSEMGLEDYRIFKIITLVIITVFSLINIKWIKSAFKAIKPDIKFIATGLGVVIINILIIAFIYGAYNSENLSRWEISLDYVLFNVLYTFGTVVAICGPMYTNIKAYSNNTSFTLLLTIIIGFMIFSYPQNLPYLIIVIGYVLLRHYSNSIYYSIGIGLLLNLTGVILIHALS